MQALAEADAVAPAGVVRLLDRGAQGAAAVRTAVARDEVLRVRRGRGRGGDDRREHARCAGPPAAAHRLLDPPSAPLTPRHGINLGPRAGPVGDPWCGRPTPPTSSSRP